MSNATINRGSAVDGWAKRPRLRDASFVVRDETGRWFLPTWIDRPVSRAWWKWGTRHPDPVLAKAQSEAKRWVMFELWPMFFAVFAANGWINQQPWSYWEKLLALMVVAMAIVGLLIAPGAWALSFILPARNATRPAQMLVAVNRCGVCAEQLSRDEHDRPRTCGTCSATWKPARAVSRLRCFGCGESLQLDADQSTLRCIGCGFDHWPMVQAARDAQDAAMRQRLTCDGCGYDRRGLNDPTRDPCPECAATPDATRPMKYATCAKCGYDRRGLTNVETDACPECGLSPASVLDMIEKLGADRGFKPDRSSPPPL